MNMSAMNKPLSFRFTKKFSIVEVRYNEYDSEYSDVSLSRILCEVKLNEF